MTTKGPALVDYLVSVFTSAATLGAAAAPNTVTVYDGPATTELDPPLKLFVGLTDPDNEAIEPAVTVTQSRDDLGSATRLEQSEVHCCAEAWSGSDTLAAVRLSVAGIVAAAESVIRSDTTGFGGNAALAAPGFAVGDLLQNNTTTGAVARIPFSVIFKSFT